MVDILGKVFMKNTFKLVGNIALVAVIGFSMANCDLFGFRGSGRLRNLDIVGARTLIVAPAGSLSRAVRDGKSTEPALLKQLDDGTWVKVRMSDETGREIQKKPPDFIYNATDDWLFIAFIVWHSSGLWGHTGEVYLVNKSNGDVYDISQIGYTENAFTDKNGNIYYLASKNQLSGIIKITVGETKATASWIVSSDIYSISGYAVDNDANILYYYFPDTNTYYLKNYRIRTANGTTIPLDGKNPSGGLFIIGYDGHIYHNFDNKLSKVEIKGNTIDDIIISPVSFEGNNNESATSFFIPEMDNYSKSRKFIFPDKMVLYDQDNNRIFTIYKNGSTPKYVSLNNIPSNIKSITAGSKDIFIWAGNNIITVDPETGTTTTKVSSTEYDLIYRFEVTFNDVIIINALTFDGKKILANIYPNGRKEILNESMDETKTFVLVKIR